MSWISSDTRGTLIAVGCITTIIVIFMFIFWDSGRATTRHTKECKTLGGEYLTNGQCWQGKRIMLQGESP
jgi:hypothetical protein